ncbi:MAG: hypothetical protein KGS61_14545, partial [Verrucomicrobia bacterium]|nr:hypothetical protein [Verrucomicrobiota bacterium]
TVRYLALGWNATTHAVRTVDQCLSDAARLDGASRWQLIRWVHWPQLAPQLAAAWYLTYLLCLWDVETLVLIIPPGSETAALRVFNLLHYGHTGQVNSLCLLLLLLAVVPLPGWWLLQLGRARPRRTGDGIGFEGSLPGPCHGARVVSTRRSAGPPEGGTTNQRLARFMVSCQAPSRMGSLPAPSSSAAVAFVLASLCTGCAPASPNESPLDSNLFSRVQVIGSRGTALGQFSAPPSVAVDTQDNLYVVDTTGRVQKFSPDGRFLSFWQMPQTEKGEPKGMCRDGTGNIVLLEPHYARVNHFTPTGKLVAQWGQTGTNPGQFFFPRAVAVNTHGEIYVSDSGAVDRIERFTALGKQLLNTFGQSGPGPGQFSRAEGLGVDAEDRVYVADSCNHRIQVFTREGRFIRAYGKPGTAPGEFNYPYDVRVDPTGLQFVCEFGNSRIQVFDAHDQLVEVLGRAGSAPGQFFNPWSIALDSRGDLYVADTGNHRVQKFIRR